MGPACRGLFLAAWVALVASAQRANAQTTTPSDGTSQQSQVPQASPSQPGDGGVFGAQTSVPAALRHEDALENPVLEQADEDDKVTSLESRVVFKYNHAAFDGSSRGLLTAWLRMSPGSNRSGQTRNAETGSISPCDLTENRCPLAGLVPIGWH